MNIPNFRGAIKLHEPLAAHTSYRIGGPADVLALPADREDLVRLMQAIKSRGAKYFVLGGGTNLLVRDGGFRGVAVCLERMQTAAVVRQYRSLGGTFAVLKADAGASLQKLVALAAENSLTGMEFGVGIPGTVGGAVCMNAGTSAGSIGDVIEAVSLLTPDGEIAVRSREEMGFGYRTALIPAGHIVVEAQVILRQDDGEKIKSRMKALLDARKDRQPWGLPNAGSVFKNPLDEAAGKLIETAGLKGRRIGGAQISDQHANFIVNAGNATAADVLKLMEIVQEKVLDVHKIRLEPEIKIIGED